MGIKELKLYPFPIEYKACKKNGVWNWEGGQINNPGVLAIIDRDKNHQTCMRDNSCNLTLEGICKVPSVYTTAKPLTDKITKIQNIYLLIYQDACGNDKCKKEKRTRLGALQITVSAAKKEKTTWKISAKVNFFVSVSMVLEVTSSGIKVIKDGSGHLKEGAIYPSNSVWICESCPQLKF